MLDSASLIAPLLAAILALSGQGLIGIVRAGWTSRAAKQKVKSALTRALTELEWEFSRFQSFCTEPANQGVYEGRLTECLNAFLAAIGDARSLLSQGVVDASAAALAEFEEEIENWGRADSMDLILDGPPGGGVLLTALFDRQVTTLFRDAVSAIGRIALPREIA